MLPEPLTNGQVQSYLAKVPVAIGSSLFQIDR